jgi:hypothetical protein
VFLPFGAGYGVSYFFRRQHAVASELVHRALEAMHTIGGDPEEILDDPEPPFRAALLREVHRILDVGEQNCDLLAVAFQGGADRSWWRAGGWGVVRGLSARIVSEGTGDGGPAVSATPHAPQNFSLCSLGSPQAAQNFRLSRFSWAQAMQRIVVASAAVTGSEALWPYKKGFEQLHGNLVRAVMESEVFPQRNPQ